MSEHHEDGTVTCELCLDWRAAQGRSMGDHVAGLLTAVVADLGIDPTDPEVRAKMGNRLRQYGAGITDL